MHDHLYFSVLFLGYNPHNHDCMPSNTTSNFDACKTWRFLQQFDILRNQKLSGLKNRVYIQEKFTICILSTKELLQKVYSWSYLKHYYNGSVTTSVSLSAKSNLTELVSTYFSPTPSPTSRKCRRRSLKWKKMFFCDGKYPTQKPTHSTHKLAARRIIIVVFEKRVNFQSKFKR